MQRAYEVMFILRPDMAEEEIDKLISGLESNVTTSGGKVKEVEKETVNGQTIYLAEVKGADGKWSKIYVKEAGDLLKVEPDNARNKRKHKPLFGD